MWKFLVTQKRSRHPGWAWMPGHFIAGSAPYAGSRAQPARWRVLWLLTRPRAPSGALGIAVAATFIVVETVVVCSLNVVTGSTGRFGTLYLIGVLVVSAVWGLGLSATISVASAIAFAYFRGWPTAHFAPFEPQNWVVIGAFLIVGLVASTLAGLARVGERFFDLSPDLLCIAGPERVIRLNPAFKEILGYSLGDLASRSWIDLVVPEDRDRVRTVLEQLPGSAEPVRFENRIICSDGSQRWVEWSVVWHQGLFYGVGRDITERRREQDELHQAQAVAEESSDRLTELADQQAALRRVATLVARGASPSEVFAAVSDELAHVLHVVNAGLLRFEPDGTGFVVAVQYEPGITGMPVTGERIPLAGDDVGARVLHSGRPARIDNHARVGGPEAERIRETGIHSIVGVPVIVDGRLWGAAIVGSGRPEPMPPDTEARIGDFADLVATAIANAATRSELQASQDKSRMLAEQQAALRRVATLVARGTSPSEVFSAVAEEMGRCLNAGNASVNRFDGDTVTVLALARIEPGMEHKPVVGERHTLEGDSIASRVFHTGRAARLDSSELQRAPGSIAERLREMGFRCTVAVPIVVDERVWGMAAVGSAAPDPLPPDTEARIGDFADLVATAIANASTRAELQASRDELSALAEQQAALRQVATLVARGVDPSEVFSAVVVEMAHCLHADHAAVYRYADDALVPLAVCHEDGLQPLPKGLRLRLAGDNVAARVLATGGATRIDRNDDAPVPHAGRMRGLGIHSAVGVPIIVGGRAWAAAVVGSLQPAPLPPNTEARISDFADLVSTAIANAATRAELIASRARIVTAADEGRRRLERDLHDGAQQRLIALGLQTRLAEGSVPPEMQALKERLGDIVSALDGVSADLREISRGIHPAILSKGGLGPALKTLARRSAVPVTLDLAIDQRLPDSVEVGAYYVVSEALTNAAKHSRASEVAVCGQTKDYMLSLSIRDNGIGGADSGKGSGLLGLNDRVETLGGRMRIVSPVGSGTSLDVTIPFGGT